MSRRPDAEGIRLQPLARSRIEALGEPGATWLAELPDLLSDLQTRWGVVLGRGLPGGSTGYVAEATLVDGTPAVLKVVCAEDATDEMTVLRLADGQGYAKLLESDTQHQALLLERLGPQLGSGLGSGLGSDGQSPPDVLRVLADTLTRAWSGVPLASAREQLQPHRDKADRLAEWIERWWVELDRPCSEGAVRQALAYAAELADPDPAELVVVHGDPHPHNALRVLTMRPGAETGYCFADPDGFVGERAYDLGVVVRDWTSQLSPADAVPVIRSYCRILADHTGVDAERVWAWGFVERMSTGLYVATLGADAVARPFLNSVEWLSAAARR